jgi:hypothetical protein
LNSINTGIEFGKVPGSIPVYLEVTVCQFHGYQYFGNWQELLPEQQSFLIAHYIAHNWVESNKDDAQYRASLAKGK